MDNKKRDEFLYKSLYEIRTVTANLKHSLRTARDKKLSAGALSFIFAVFAFALFAVYVFRSHVHISPTSVQLVPSLVLLSLFAVYEALKNMLHFSRQESEFSQLIDQLSISAEEVKRAHGGGQADG